MKATHCTTTDLQAALNIVNKKYEGNIRFNPNSNLPKRFTLRVNNSKGLGAALSMGYLMKYYYAETSEFARSAFGKVNKRHTGSACWHVHGDFFEALFVINPAAVITARGNRIDMRGGNWIDYNVGSQVFPVYAANCCDCESVK